MGNEFMKLVYYCYGGAQTSVTCAAIHLKYLPYERVPSAKEFQSVPFYDKMENSRLGTPVYVGRDELGLDIYIMGMKNSNTFLIPLIKSYLNHCGKRHDDLIFVNARVRLHPITSIGGFITRKLGIVTIGRPMTVWGIRRTYPVLLDLVKGVKEKLRSARD